MHERDRPPDTRFITDERFVVQWMANISLILGALTIIGALLALISSKSVFLLLSALGIILAFISMRLARRIPDERARVTAVMSLILNIVVFFITLVVYLFVKEAAMAL